MLRLLQNHLLWVAGLLLIFVVSYLLAPSPLVLRTIGVLVVFFLPGYALTAALAPGRKDLTAAERLGMSLGISMTGAVVLALLWSYTPIGITAHTTLVTLVGTTLLASLVAWLRGLRLPQPQRFAPRLPLGSLPWGRDPSEKLASGFAALAALAAIGSFLLAMYYPKTGERFTEFYLLNRRGAIGNYPHLVEVGKPQQVLLGIANREGRSTRYRAQVLLDGVQVGTAEVSLRPGETWEQPVTITPPRPGSQKAEFLLYRSSDRLPYRSLHLWLDARLPHARYTEVYVEGDVENLYLWSTMRYRVTIANHEERPVYYQVYIRKVWPHIRKGWLDEEPERWRTLGETGVVELQHGQTAVLESGVEITFDPTERLGYLDIILAKTGPEPLPWHRLDPSMVYRVVRLPLYNQHSKV